MSTLADAHALFRHFSDVTLVSAEGQQATIHPLILVARSTLVRRIFFDLPDSESHPVIYLPDFSYLEVNQCLEALIGQAPCENTLLNVPSINFNY